MNPQVVGSFDLRKNHLYIWQTYSHLLTNSQDFTSKNYLLMCWTWCPSLTDTRIYNNLHLPTVATGGGGGGGGDGEGTGTPVE